MAGPRRQGRVAHRGRDSTLSPTPPTRPPRGSSADSGETISVTAQTLRKRLNGQGLLASTDQARDGLTVRHILEGKRREILHLHPESLTADSPAQPSQPRHSSNLAGHTRQHRRAHWGRWDGWDMPQRIHPAQEREQGGTPTVDTPSGARTRQEMHERLPVPDNRRRRRTAALHGAHSPRNDPPPRDPAHQAPWRPALPVPDRLAPSLGKRGTPSHTTPPPVAAESSDPKPPNEKNRSPGPLYTHSSCRTNDRNYALHKSLCFQVFPNGPCWTRTSDLGIKSPLLYPLS